MIEVGLDGEPRELDDLSPRELVQLAQGSVLQRREADRRQVRLVLAWAAKHPAGPDDAAYWGQADRSGCEDRVGGEGCPEVQASSVAELAAALGTTTSGGLHLLEHALEVKFRLPRLYARFEALGVDLWKVRLVARLTRPLSAEAADFVDRELAETIGRAGGRAIENAVAIAIRRLHPEPADEKARRGRAGWHVDVHHPDVVDFAGTSVLDASADSLDLEDFMAALGMIAEDLQGDGAGGSDTLGQRRARAMGIIGRKITGRAEHPSPDQQPEPDPDEPPAPDGMFPVELGKDPTTPTGPRDDAGLDRITPPTSPRRRGRRAIVVHAHLADDAVGGTFYEVPRFGVVGEEVLQRWLDEHGARVTRVIDLHRFGAVDEHDPPAWMRAQVLERDRHCVFPGCWVPSEDCDVDHIIPYDEDGPPGQTNPENLGCLCRQHHLLKTHCGWRYYRARDGTYVWTSPLGQTYLTRRDGTDFNPDAA